MQHCLGSPQQFCLRWNNYQSNLTHVFDQLLQNESFVDVTLACEGHSVKAHKMVLSACSPYFQTLFFENPCKHPIVILKDIRWPELKAVVEFMYKGEINVSQEQIGPLLQVAESLKIRGLADVTGEDGFGEGKAEPVRDSSASRDARDTLRDPTGTPAGKEEREPREHRSPGQRDSARDPARDPARDSGRERDLVTRELISRSSPRDLRDSSARDGSRDPSGERESSSRPPSSLSLGGGLAGLGSHEPLPLSLPLQNPLALPLPLSSPLPMHRFKKRRRASADHSPIQGASSPESSSSNLNHSNGTPGSPGHSGHSGPGLGPSHGPGAPQLQGMPAAADLSLAMPPPPSLSDDLEIKPGIAEMIREEERVAAKTASPFKPGLMLKPQAKLLESSSHAWLGASTSSLAADSYQYQLQHMWQKCWNTNQTMAHNLRFRERGPLKSWRPETMAEAIFSVLREGLSLSQAARKYDIPYPTFVLYANRVHNMLGPSVDGGAADLRPKGRGRPQRILLGIWPEDHIHGVIRAVVFRDPQHLKPAQDDAHYSRLAVGKGQVQSYNMNASMNSSMNSGMNGPDHGHNVTPNAATMAAMAQGLRQQMCNMVVAAAQQQQQQAQQQQQQQQQAQQQQQQHAHALQQQQQHHLQQQQLPLQHLSSLEAMGALSLVTHCGPLQRPNGPTGSSSSAQSGQAPAGSTLNCAMGLSSPLGLRRSHSPAVAPGLPPGISVTGLGLGQGMGQGLGQDMLRSLSPLEQVLGGRNALSVLGLPGMAANASHASRASTITSPPGERDRRKLDEQRDRLLKHAREDEVDDADQEEDDLRIARDFLNSANNNDLMANNNNNNNRSSAMDMDLIKAGTHAHESLFQDDMDDLCVVYPMYQNSALEKLLSLQQLILFSFVPAEMCFFDVICNTPLSEIISFSECKISESFYCSLSHYEAQSVSQMLNNEVMCDYSYDS
ncbi:protein bric-a-brac 1-like [Thrips palmi]|uniref:Protein bric-a-brac 1-like n=1 Tax=Thrips palmi TaxID=161013 RepID=A0A6P9A898_THRPL|nr:protein bric-a-brac 1-like [Thrips palmi]